MQTYLFIMTKYVVEVYETYEKNVLIEANTPEEAEEKAEELWSTGFIQFDYDASEFTNPEFICVREEKE